MLLMQAVGLRVLGRLSEVRVDEVGGGDVGVGSTPPMNGADVAALLQAAPLRIGVSTRALFDLEQEHAVFVGQGVRAYAALQRKREDVVIGQGCGFEVVRRLLALNKANERPFVDVVLLSRNSPDLSLRAFNSIEHYGLPTKTGSFTSGRSLAPFVSAWRIDLFLSNEADDVQAVGGAGAAAAKLGVVPSSAFASVGDEVRIAFDGDAVVFSADEVYKANGLEASLDHERRNATNPMSGGPFGTFSGSCRCSDGRTSAMTRSAASGSAS